MRKTYYSGIKHTKSHKPPIYTIICTVVALLLITFIIWAGVTYGQYSDQGREAINQAETLKKEIEKKDEKISSLNKEIDNYKKQLEQEKEKVQMLLDTGATLPEKTETTTNTSTHKTTGKKSTTRNKTTKSNSSTESDTTENSSASGTASSQTKTPETTSESNPSSSGTSQTGSTANPQ